MSRIFLLIADPLVAARMRHILDASGQLVVVGFADRLAQAAVQLAATPADLVLGDLTLPDGHFADLMPLLERDPVFGRPQTLALTMSLDDPQLLQAVVQGVDGWYVHGHSPQALLEAIARTRAGLADMTPTIARQVRALLEQRASAGAVAASDEAAQPTSRERSVLDAVASGLLPHEIAREQQVSLREVGTCIRTLYRKLHQASVAARLAMPAPAPA